MQPVEIFFSYAHEDEELMDAVRRQLIVEERTGRILKWHDRKIPPGTEWKEQIDDRLNYAKIILLFMSPHFIESKYCYEIEGKYALDRHETGKARVIPVILRPCLWQKSPFGKLQALPRDAKPISTWQNQDEASLSVAEGVLDVVDELMSSIQLGKGREATSSQMFFAQPQQINGGFSSPKYKKIEKLMPTLLEEMRKDLQEHPTIREFIILKSTWIYIGQGTYLAYYLDNHEDLIGKLQVLANLGFVREITYNNVQRFLFDEIFVDYLVNTSR